MKVSVPRIAKPVYGASGGTAVGLSWVDGMTSTIHWIAPTMPDDVAYFFACLVIVLLTGAGAQVMREESGEALVHVKAEVSKQIQDALREFAKSTEQGTGGQAQNA